MKFLVLLCLIISSSLSFGYTCFDKEYQPKKKPFWRTFVERVRENTEAYSSTVLSSGRRLSIVSGECIAEVYSEHKINKQKYEVKEVKYSNFGAIVLGRETILDINDPDQIISFMTSSSYETPDLNTIFIHMKYATKTYGLSYLQKGKDGKWAMNYDISKEIYDELKSKGLPYAGFMYISLLNDKLKSNTNVTVISDEYMGDEWYKSVKKFTRYYFDYELSEVAGEPGSATVIKAELWENKGGEKRKLKDLAL